MQQVLEALQQVLAVALDRLAEHFRVGQREVGRRQRVDVLAGEEVDLVLRVRVDPFDRADRIVQVTRGDQVRLLHEVEQEVLLPVLVLEALVALGRRGDRIGKRDTHHLHRRVLPQREVIPHHVHLRLRELDRVGQQARGQVHERLGHAEFVGGHGDALLGSLLEMLGQDARGTLRDFGVGMGNLCGIGHLFLFSGGDSLRHA